MRGWRVPAIAVAWLSAFLTCCVLGDAVAAAVLVRAPAVIPVSASPTVYDATLNVTWLADSDLAATDTFGVPGINPDGSMSYQTAVGWIAAMNASDYLGHRTWKLPTTPANGAGCQSTGRHGHRFGFGCRASALGSLYYRTFRLHPPATAVAIPDLTAGPFNHFQPYMYWTGTVAGMGGNGYRAFSFNTGWAGGNVSLHSMYVLPMVVGNRYRTPTPVGGRGLYASADGKTVWDPSADVTWLADADLAATHKFQVGGIDRDGSMEHQTAMTWIEAMDAHDWLHDGNWQLPTATACTGFDCGASPLGQLYFQELGHRAGEPVVPTPDTSRDGFADLQPYLYWSCEGQHVQRSCSGFPAPGFGWSFSFNNGFTDTTVKADDLYVTAYYPGRSKGTTTTPTCTPPPTGKPNPCM